MQKLLTNLIESEKFLLNSRHFHQINKFIFSVQLSSVLTPFKLKLNKLRWNWLYNFAANFYWSALSSITWDKDYSAWISSGSGYNLAVKQRPKPVRITMFASRYLVGEIDILPLVLLLTARDLCDLGEHSRGLFSARTP